MSVNALFATAFGIGRTPYMPGTAASAVAALIAWFVAPIVGHWMLLPLGLAVGAAGIFVSGAYARERGEIDPSSCVIDEVAGQWIALAFAPISLPAFALAFFFFRFFDMIKPWPISAAEKLPGGYGIIADDVLAGLIAGLIVYVFVIAGYL